MPSIPLLLSLLLLPSWLQTLETGAPSSQIERILYAMGTRLEVSAQGTSRQMALQASERAVLEIRKAEALLSTWSEPSPLSRLGQVDADSVVEVSPDLGEVLERVEGCRLATEGAFSLTPDQLGPSFRQLSDGTFRRIGAGTFDSGAFGKGEALDQATSVFLQSDGTNRIQLNFGGQIAVAARTEAQVLVHLAHPLDRNQPALLLDLEAAPQLSIATSGNSERGRRTPHIRDPRTNDAATDFGSLTVVARSAFEADCLSTGLFVLGPEAALTFANEHPHVSIIVLEIREGSLIARTSGELPGRVTAVLPDLKIVPFDASGRSSQEVTATRRHLNGE